MLPPEHLCERPSDAALKKAIELIKALEEACDRDEHTPPALYELHRLTGHDHLTTSDYFQISGAMSYENAAILAFCPKPSVIKDLSFSQFQWLCTKMLARLGEDDFDYWYNLYCLNAKNSRAGDLVFHPPQDWIDRLIEEGSIPPSTEPLSFEPTAECLAQEAWRSDAILL